MMRTIATIATTVILAGSFGCGGSSVMQAAPKTVTVSVLDNAYDPKSIQINRGDTVRWVLVGSDPSHTVTALSGAFDSGFAFQQNGDVFEHTFTQDNVTFEYSCQSHKSCCAMQGSVLVGGGAPSPMPGY